MGSNRSARARERECRRSVSSRSDQLGRHRTSFSRRRGVLFNFRASRFRKNKKRIDVSSRNIQSLLRFSLLMLAQREKVASSDLRTYLILAFVTHYYCALRIMLITNNAQHCVIDILNPLYSILLVANFPKRFPPPPLHICIFQVLFL